MSDKLRNRYWLDKKAKKGFRGYPVATIAYYGPDNQVATKVVVGILNAKEEITAMEKWFSDNDLRYDRDINQQIVAMIDEHKVKSTVIMDGIIGCPHEEGIDYPEGENCPECPFWANRDRWTGEMIH